MAKGKFDEWLKNDKLILLQGWAREGLTDEQIANNIGISRKTLYEWKNKYSDICNVLKINKEAADYQVENALYRAAINGNITAQIYWLKCRKPDKWRENRPLPADTEDIKRITEILDGVVNGS